MKNILERIFALMIIIMVTISLLFWEHPYLAEHSNKDNSYRNLVPSSGQSRGLDDYGCGPIRI